MPPQRRRPDIDETREVLRKHDERVHDEPEPPEDAEPDEGDEEKPETPQRGVGSGGVAARERSCFVGLGGPARNETDVMRLLVA